MIEAFIPNTPEWAIPLLDVLTFLIGSLGSLRIMVTGKITGLSGKLDNHIKSDEIYHTQMLEKIEETITETKRNSKALSEYNDNSRFFADLINIGFMGILDIEKYNNTNERENKEEANKKVNEYITLAVDLISELCRDIMTVGIENVTRDFIYSKTSNKIQRGGATYIRLWGEEHGKVYMRLGTRDRDEFIGQILAISTDIANNKLDRFRKATLHYTHEMVAGFCRYYYSNKLN